MIALAEGQCGGSYSDSFTLLASLLSRIAAEIWPGDGIDRRRFIELWTCYSDHELQPNLISVPLLTQSLRAEERESDAKLLEAVRPEMLGLTHSTRVLRGSDVDMEESEVATRSPTIPRREVRAHSYPAVFYKHVRSNLAHEFKLSNDAASHFATRLTANVSYVNRYDPESPVLSRRQIHFHIGWLTEIARSTARNTASLIDNYEVLRPPITWWIEGRDTNIEKVTES